MIRITELRLPIDHPPEALEAALLARLKITKTQLLGFDIFKRSYDARKNTKLTLIYTLDVRLDPALQEKTLDQFAGDIHVKPSPDFWGKAPVKHLLLSQLCKLGEGISTN